MRRSHSMGKPEEKERRTRKRQHSGESPYETVRNNPFLEMSSSLSSSDSSDNDIWSIWNISNERKVEKLGKNRTDSYKLAFPPRRTNQPSKKTSSESNSKRPHQILPGQNKAKQAIPPNEKRGASAKNMTISSVYTVRVENKSPEAKPRRKKIPTLKDKEEPGKPKVSFSDYAQLNGKLERLEAFLTKNETDLSEELSELIRIKNESLADEARYHPIPDPVAFTPATPRLRRLTINTEILQYYYLYCILTLFGVVLITMTYFWLSIYRGGLSEMINMHILFAMIGFFFLSSQGILVFRTTRYTLKEDSPRVTWWSNMIHCCVHTISVVLSCAAVVMAFLSRAWTSSSPHLYSLHSWIGIFTFVLYTAIFMMSLVYFHPRFTQATQLAILPTHVALSMSSFLMIVSACLSGLMGAAVTGFGEAYATLPPGGVLVNLIGVFIVIYCGFFIYLIQTVKDV